MLIKSLKVFSLLLLIALAGCNGSSTEDGAVSINEGTSRTNDDKLIRANRYMIQKNMEVIKGYIGRHGLKMEFSGLGYYYGLMKKGNGTAPIRKGSVVLYEYKVSLIDGTPLDSSRNDLSQLIIDKSSGISGLHDGLKKFNEGDSVLFIFPPHVAYGLIGDGSKIPARSTLVYSVKIKSVR